MATSLKSLPSVTVIASYHRTRQKLYYFIVFYSAKGYVDWHYILNIHDPDENTRDGLKNTDKPYTVAMVY